MCNLEEPWRERDREEIGEGGREEKREREGERESNFTSTIGRAVPLWSIKVHTTLMVRINSVCIDVNVLQ